MHQEYRITVHDLNSRERHPSALTLESVEGTQDEDELSLQDGPTDMIEYEGASVPTTYKSTGSASSEVEEPSMKMYGRNTRADTRIPVGRVLFEDQNVRFKHPGCKQDNHPKRGIFPSGGRGIICHICYEKDEKYSPECALTLREHGRVLSIHESLDETER